jgi:hypothetical protein
MQRSVRLLLVGCFLTTPVVAQRGGGGHGGMVGGFHGGVGGGFRGGGFAGPGFRGGFGGFHHGFNGFRGGFGPRNRVVFGFGYYPGAYWPYYGAGWGYPYYGYPYYDVPYSGYSYPPAYYDYGPSASSPVVIYQSQPPVTLYEVLPREQPETASTQGNENPIYLIALKGQDNVCAAQAYWFTGDTLHFITLEGEAKQAPTKSIDRAVTLRLNRDRHVDFRIPSQ